MPWRRTMSTAQLHALTHAHHVPAGPPEPVLLDVSSIAPDRILLLDAYFYVVGSQRWWVQRGKPAVPGLPTAAASCSSQALPPALALVSASCCSGLCC